MTSIASVQLSLVVGIAELADRTAVLLPLLECGVFGTKASSDPVWMGRLEFENLAHLVNQVSQQISTSIGPLSKLLEGSLKIPPERLAYAADHLLSAGETLRESAIRLRALAEGSPSHFG